MLESFRSSSGALDTSVLRRKDADRNRRRARRTAGHDQEPDQARIGKAAATLTRSGTGVRGDRTAHTSRSLAALYALGRSMPHETERLRRRTSSRLPALRRVVGAAEADAARACRRGAAAHCAPGVELRVERTAATRRRPRSRRRQGTVPGGISRRGARCRVRARHNSCGLLLGSRIARMQNALVADSAAIEPPRTKRPTASRRFYRRKATAWPR